MKLTLFLPFSVLAASSHAFQIGTPARPSTFLSAAKDDCKQGDMSAECLLSETELSWSEGKAGQKKYENKGDAQLLLELATHKARISYLQEAIDKGCEETAQKALECEVDDPRVECMLSEVEQKWFSGDSGEQNELSMAAELAKEKNEVAVLEKKVNEAISSGNWKNMNQL